MAVTPTIYEWQNSLILLENNLSDLSICEFGDQVWHSNSDTYHDYSMSIFYMGKVYWYAAIDIHGRNGVFKHDLEIPLEPKWSGFDVVTCYSMLQHVNKPTEVINNALRVAAGNGIILFCVPCEQNSFTPNGAYLFKLDFAERLARTTQTTLLSNRKLKPFPDKPWEVIVFAIQKTPGFKYITPEADVTPFVTSTKDTLHTGNYTTPGTLAVNTDQDFQELTWMVNFMLEKEVKSAIVLGSEYGGVEWEIARRYQEKNLALHILGLDHRIDCTRQAINYIHEHCPLIQYTALNYDLNQPDMKNVLFGKYDFVFIDADHSYDFVKSNFEFALRHTNKYIAFHDLIDAKHFGPGDFVAKFWREVISRYNTIQMIQDKSKYGIGIVDLTKMKTKGTRA